MDEAMDETIEDYKRLKTELTILRESHERLRAALASIQAHGDDDHECGHARQSGCIGEMQSIARDALAEAIP